MSEKAAEEEVWHPSTLAEEPARPSQQLRALVDDVLDNEPHFGAAAAAEAAAKALGFQTEWKVKDWRGYPAVRVALDGQKPRSGWRRILCFGTKGMWESGTWITVSDAYRSGNDDKRFSGTSWPMAHEVQYR